jgi:UDP-glucose 4-epimerase
MDGLLDKQNLYKEISMNIFLTGGTGFIGSYVTKLLSDRGHSLSILARNPEKIPALHHLPGVTIIPGTLSDFNIIDEQMKGKDACIHIALGWGDEAMSMLQHDTLPSVYLFECAARHKLSRFIYTSSTAAVNNTPPDSKEGPEGPQPSDFYGATKASSEKYLYALSHQSSMICSIIRPGYTFGNPVIPGAPIENDDRFRYIVKQAKKNEVIELITYDGTQFIHARDLAKVYDAVLHKGENRKSYFALGSIFYSWEEIAKKVIEMTHSKSRITLIDKGYNPKPSLFNITLIKKDFNLEFESWQGICNHLEYLVNLE